MRLVVLLFYMNFLWFVQLSHAKQEHLPAVYLHFICTTPRVCFRKTVKAGL